MFHKWLLIAQTAPAVDPLSGGAGWVGAGLLGLVLFWLTMKHLPDKDRQIKDLIDRHDLLIDKLTDRHTATCKDMTSNFAAAINRVTDHCKEELETIVDRYLQEMKRLNPTTK